MSKKILGMLGLFALPLVLWAGVVNAQSFRSGDNVTVSPNEVISRTLFAAGQSLDIAGEIDGDLFCAGQNVVISGSVSGDVICAAQTLRVSGDVGGDVRVAGQNVTIGSQIEDGLSAAAQSFVLQSGASVGRDAQVAAQDSTFNGQIQRDLSLATQSAVLGNNIGRDVSANLDTMRLGANAKIGGDVTYTSQNTIDIADGAVISGETTRNEPEDSKQGPGYRGELFLWSFSFGIYAILSLLLVALAVVLLFPQALHETSRWALESPGKTLLIGLVALLVAPVAIISLSITLIGIPLAILLGLLWLLTLFLSGPFTGYYVGRLMFRGNPKSPIVTMLVGSIVLLLIYFIPFIGALAGLLASWFGTGMILSELMRRTPKPAYDHHKRSIETGPVKKQIRKITTTNSKSKKPKKK